MRSEFEKAFPIPAHWIEFDEKANKYYCPYVADAKASEYQSMWKVWQHQQSKVDELQKRVDASLIAFEKLKEEINQLHGQCDLHLIKYLEEKSQVLEQALKGGGE